MVQLFDMFLPKSNDIFTVQMQMHRKQLGTLFFLSLIAPPTSGFVSQLRDRTLKGTCQGDDCRDKMKIYGEGTLV